MSQRTFCDRCGRECVAGMRRSVAHITEIEFAKADPRHPVAEDSYAPADLCDICTDVIKEAFGPALRTGQHYGVGEDGMESTQLMPQPFWVPPDGPFRMPPPPPAEREQEWAAPHEPTRVAEIPPWPQQPPLHSPDAPTIVSNDSPGRDGG